MRAGQANGHAAAQNGKVAEQAEEEEEEQAPKKKAKKDKKAGKGSDEAETNGSTGSLMAKVGDADLARNSKPIKKDLYKKVHADVAAMDEQKVQALRVERATTLEGPGGALDSGHTLSTLILSVCAVRGVLCRAYKHSRVYRSCTGWSFMHSIQAARACCLRLYANLHASSLHT